MSALPSTLSGPPPPPCPFAAISFPRPSILLVVFSNPKSLNCISTAVSAQLEALWSWYDGQPSLRCCIVTGAGRAFCAGADLKEWNDSNSKGGLRVLPPSGFGGLSRRMGKKPVIGAVNGLALGGGMEMVVNLDLVVAAKSAVFGLPEVKRGVAAIGGALPRIVRTVGKQRAMELVLTGRTLGAEEARAWGIVNAVTEDAGADVAPVERPVVRKALELAEMIGANSPDSVIVSRAGVIMGWEDGSAENGSRVLNENYGKRLNEGENIKEGVMAFVEKRAPRWVPSKL